MGTCVQTTEEIDRLMEMTDPDLVFLLYDTGHLVCSGEDPIYILKKYLPRIRHVHLKDIRMDIRNKVKEENMSFLAGVRAGMFTVPGDGDFDFGPVFDIINDSDYDGWFIVEAEQDPAKANRSSTRSRLASTSRKKHISDCQKALDSQKGCSSVHHGRRALFFCRFTSSLGFI